MALTVIGPLTSTSDLTIAGQSYAEVATEIEFEGTVDSVDITTFADEPDSAYTQGQTVNRFRFAAILKQNGIEAGPILPLPQGAAVALVFATGASLSFTGNFTRLVVRRAVKQAGVMAGEGIVTSSVLKTWDVTP